MYSIVTTFKRDTVPFVCHTVSAFNTEHCRILAFDLVKRHFGSIQLEYHDQGQGRYTICSQGRVVGCVGFGPLDEVFIDGTRWRVQWP